MSALPTLAQATAGHAFRCPVAPDGRCDFESLGPFFDRSGLFDQVEVHRCRRCGLGVSEPAVPDVSVLYADRTSQDFQPRTSGLARAIKEFVFRRQAKRMLAETGFRPKRILDYGCGSGLFTRCLGDVAIGCEVVGVDFHSTPPAELAGRHYVNFAAAKGAQADLLIAMHVLEHDEDPQALLARMIALVKPGGRILIEVPNIDCFWTRVFGAYWDAWYLPYHRLHYSRASLRSVLQGAGLEILQETNARVPTMGRTFANLLGMLNTLPFVLLGAVLHPVQLVGEYASDAPSALRVLARVRA